MMELTPFRKTVLVMLLVAIPWLLVGVVSVAFLMQAHLEEGMKYSFGMKISIVVGGIMCMLALVVCADAVRKQQANPLLYIFAFSGFWFLLEWPGKALMAILRS
ncbi:hypothetical protein [Sideroxydans sp. CL21]|uniref:hypothetical protein n=1 Tax=Sideroxydans sp. CL21 TaxID=2600596 RepID=UPI0024BC0157|nr:hypothetical protein [Sideroxydans sp. CL21]